MEVLFTTVPVFFVLMFVIGLVFGSFMNVLVFRREKDEPITGRSQCPHCKHTLQWFELVPVLSYLLQRGRCKKCQVKLSMQYPLVELATGLTFLLVACRVGEAGEVFVVPLVFGLIVWFILLLITVYDFRTKLIPDHFNIAFSVVALAYLGLEYLAGTHTSIEALYWLITGPALFLPFYLLWKVSDGRWIGLGDGKFALGMGWLLGPIGGPSAVLFAFWIGAVVSLLLIAIQYLIARYKKGNTTSAQLTLKSEIPFGPFLVLGTAVVYFTHITIFTLFL